jgi:hypothetical protein
MRLTGITVPVNAMRTVLRELLDAFTMPVLAGYILIATARRRFTAIACDVKLTSVSLPLMPPCVVEFYRNARPTKLRSGRLRLLFVWCW